MDQFSYEPDDFATADAAERNGSRDSLLLTAMLRVRGLADPVQVRVRNLSSGGLMAEYGGQATGGDPVLVEVRGIGWIAGSIAWVTDGRLGISFEAPIDPLLARKPVVARAPKKRVFAPL